ncbi:hypothetical protein BC826DRAFT_698145 [Russula brevipes]|nr:hypothetical protein BC826DRAFT_698145 [Russula brevipes]
MLSGPQLSTNPQLNFSNFDAFAIAVGCTQPSGPQRLQCLRSVPVSVIRTYTNGPESGIFVPGVDKCVFHSVPSSEERHIPSWACSVTVFDDPLQRIRTGQIARVPTLLGTTKDDGTVFALIYPNVSTFLVNQFGPIGNTFLPAELQALYPQMNDTQLFDAVVRDVLFRWCVIMVSPSVEKF